MRFGFCGPTYQARSPNVDAERCFDLLPEAVDSPSGRSKMSLYSRPGYNIFANLGSTAVLGGFSCQPNGSTTDRDFEVVQNGPNQSLIELFSDGSQKFRGQISPPTTTNVTFAQNGTQLAICTGGQVWVFTFATNTLTGPVSDLNGVNVAMIDYCDAFGVALVANSNKFQISALLDFTSWPGLNVGEVSEFPDNVISMVVNQRGIWFQGRKATVPYYNAGYYPVPFVPVDGIFIESGTASQFGRAKLDNSIFWWDASERGQGVARRAVGYTPQRISTHSVETFIASYPRIDDAISWAEEREGHTLFFTYFPSGWGADQAQNDGNPRGATWVYDVSTGMWSEWSYWNAKKGCREAYHARNYRFAWGKHLLGDWNSGNVYVSSFPVPKAGGWDYVTDAGNPIKIQRRAPHVSYEREYVYHHSFEVVLEVGISPQPPLNGPSEYPPSYILADANGGKWLVTVDDEGILHAEPVTVSLDAVTPVINDPQTNLGYSLSVALDSQGQFDGLLATPAYFEPSNPASLPFATSGSYLDCLVIISNAQATTTAPYAHAREPYLNLMWSDDAGHTWSQVYQLNCGKAGEYRMRARKINLGRSRVRTYDVSSTDPLPWRIADADVEASPGFQPQKRTIRQFAENA